MKRPWHPEIHIELDKIREVIVSQFPEFGDQTVKLLGFGWDNDAYLVGDHIFRFPRRHIAVEGFLFELAALRLLPDDLPLAVPRVTHVGKPSEAFPYPFLAYPLLQGTLASDHPERQPATAADAATLGEFLRLVHQVPATIGGDIRGDTMRKADQPYRLERIKQALDAIDSLHLHADKAELIKAAEELAKSKPAAHAVLVHGDLYSRHLVLGADDRVTGVIDWGDAHVGDPAQDLSIAYTYLDKDTEGAMWDAYQGADHDTKLRSMFKALFYGAVLTDFGVGNDDKAIYDVGQHSIRRVLESI